jgi:hypothetical protein
MPLELKRVDLSAAKYTEFRTLYAVERNGELMAFYGMKKGFRTNWRLWPLMIARGELSYEGVAPDTSGYRAIDCYGKGKDAESIERALDRFKGTAAGERFVTRAALFAKIEADKLAKAEAHVKYVATLRAAFETKAARRAALYRILAKLDLNSGVSREDHDELRTVIDELTAELKRLEIQHTAAQAEAVT